MPPFPVNKQSATKMSFLKWRKLLLRTASLRQVIHPNLSFC